MNEPRAVALINIHILNNNIYINTEKSVETALATEKYKLVKFTNIHRGVKHDEPYHTRHKTEAAKQIYWKTKVKTSVK